MAQIVYEPDQHNCQTELREEFGYAKPVGTIAQCSCGAHYRMYEDQRDGKYWSLYSGPIKRT